MTSVQSSQAGEMLQSPSHSESTIPQPGHGLAEELLKDLPGPEACADKNAPTKDALHPIPKASLLGLPTELLDLIVLQCQPDFFRPHATRYFDYFFYDLYYRQTYTRSTIGPKILPIAQTCRRLRDLSLNIMFENSHLAIGADSPKKTVAFLSLLSFKTLNTIREVRLVFQESITTLNHTSFSQICGLLGSMKSLKSLTINMPLRPQLPEDCRAEHLWYKEHIHATEEKKQLWWNTRSRPWLRDLFTINSAGSNGRSTYFRVMQYRGGSLDKNVQCHEFEIWINSVLAEDWESRKARLKQMDESESGPSSLNKIVATTLGS